MPAALHLMTSSNRASTHRLLLKIRLLFVSVQQRVLLYVCSKFVRQEAVGIHYIRWPPKKLLPKILYQVGLPKKAKSCAACTAN